MNDLQNHMNSNRKAFVIISGFYSSGLQPEDELQARTKQWLSDYLCKDVLKPCDECDGVGHRDEVLCAVCDAVIAATSGTVPMFCCVNAATHEWLFYCGPCAWAEVVADD